MIPVGVAIYSIMYDLINTIRVYDHGCNNNKGGRDASHIEEYLEISNFITSTSNIKNCLQEFDLSKKTREL